MQIYSLRNKMEDALFLEGDEINCPAVLDVREYTSLSEAPSITVQLSNGKKYRATVVEIQVQQIDKRYQGHIRIRRTQRG